MKRKVITAICIGAVLAVSGCSGTASTAGEQVEGTKAMQEAYQAGCRA